MEESKRNDGVRSRRVSQRRVSCVSRRVCRAKKKEKGLRATKDQSRILSTHTSRSLKHRALQLAHVTCVWRNEPTPSTPPSLSLSYPILRLLSHSSDTIRARSRFSFAALRFCALPCTPVPPESRMMRSWSFLISFSRCSSFASVRPNRSSCLPISF